jgi:FkbM family methyltransferase
MRTLIRRPHWLLWHPHQKLWNWSLVGVLRRLLGETPVRPVVIRALVTIDSLLLVGRVGIRLLRATVGSPGKHPTPSVRPRVLYIDCGVHKRGEQIRCMHRWFADRYELQTLAFEASSEHFRDASTALADVDGVRLHHLALVGPDHVGEEVRLYKTGGGGHGDSLFAARGESYDLVPARRLSQVLADEGYVLGELPVILRMNIEGAEQFVIADLIDAGLHASIDGYYGMWDDLSKIDPATDRRFRRLLRDHSISTVTFNDRDLNFRMRRYAIRKDIATSLRAGLARVKTHTAQAPSRGS